MDKIIPGPAGMNIYNPQNADGDSIQNNSLETKRETDIVSVYFQVLYCTVLYYIACVIM